MNVQLYVYDLSQGLARQFSQQFLGTQIDAVYHTAIVFGGIEYFIGQGIQTCYAGSTHHGRPMQVLSLGKTELPMEIILEYLDSLKETYSAQAYDLFLHNCNNFSNDFAMFLVGKGIPEHITSLPQRVLDTPFGQLLRPQIDNAMRSVTQAPVISPRRRSSAASRGSVSIQSPRSQHPHSKLHIVKLRSEPLKAVTYSIVPTLEKVTGKLGSLSSDSAVVALVSFIRTRYANPNVPANAALPNLPQISSFIRTTLTSNNLDAPVFPLIDLLRIALLDPRVAMYFATETPASPSDKTTLNAIFSHPETSTYAVRLTAVQALANALSHPSAARHIITTPALASSSATLVSDALLDPGKPTVRVAAATAAKNLSIALQSARRRDDYQRAGDEMPADAQVGLLAAVAEALIPVDGREEGESFRRRLLLALGWLVYLHPDFAAPEEDGADGAGELRELLEALDAKERVRTVGGLLEGKDAELAREMAEKLL